MADLPELNDEQKALALQYCATEDLGAIARRCFGETDPTTNLRIDGRSLYAKAIKTFLAGEGKEVRTTANPVLAEPDLVLSEEQKRQIEALAPKTQGLELARIVWGDPTLTPLHKKSRLVREHLKEVYAEGINMSDEPVEEREWKPPVSVTSLIGLVNQYVHQSDNRKTFNHVNLKPSEKKALESLMRYMRVYRLKYATSEMTKQVDRELFLSTFIRWSYDKPDLSEIEVDQMISAAEETVNIASIGRDIRRIEKIHEEVMSGNVTDENGKKIKLNQADAELINSVRTKHDAAKKQLKDIMSKLETARSERDQERKNRNFTVLDLIDAWMTDAELHEGKGPFRTKQIEGAIEEKQSDAAEVERLSAEEELIALISGQSKEEARS